MAETETAKAAATLAPPAGSALAAPPHHGADPLMALIQRAATDQGFSVEKLEKLLDVKERWDAEEARKAYVAALACFKRAAPTLVKDKAVSFADTNYTHATLGQVASTVAAALADHGMSHGWSVDQHIGRHDGQHNDGVTVTCTLTHERGHRESVSMTAPPDDSGKKNAIQRIGSTVTYLERYTLLAITGLAAHEQDDDGAAADGRRNAERRRSAPNRQAPKPGPAQPPIDPDTGKLLPPSPIAVKPLEHGDGSDWMCWGAALAAALKSAATAADLEAWVAANEMPLGNCRRDAPKIAERLQAIIAGHRDALSRRVDEPKSADAEAGEAA